MHTEASEREPEWRSRGYLPHFDSYAATQHVTFHLADSLPHDALERIDSELRALPPEKQKPERRRRIEAWIDAGYGSCHLRAASVASMVENTLCFFDTERYLLLEWVVMPNHIHVLFRPINGWSVQKIVTSWKAYTARRINEHRHTLHGSSMEPGVRVWHREYWDRFIRDEKHMKNAVAYIHANPVKAGLAKMPADWRWGSARLRAKQAAVAEAG